MCCCGSHAAVLGIGTVIHFRQHEACTGPSGALVIAQHWELYTLAQAAPLREGARAGTVLRKF